jgi:polyvinyl alcohol dehydrogenase (cytochrome)
VALDARSGRRRWHTYTVPPGYDGAPVWTTPALDRRRHRLYVGTGNAYHQPAFETTDAILVLDSRTGRIVRRYQATHSDVHLGHEGADPDADFGASPNLLGPDMVGGYQKSRVYWALDRRNLRPTWSRLTAKPLSRQPPEAIASTAFDGRRIYGQTDYGQVFALDLRGRRLWITLGDGRQNYSPIAVANGVVYDVHARGRLQARSAQSGRLLAQLPLGGPTWGGVSVVGGSVFVSTGNQFDTGFVVAYRPRRS